MLRVVEDGHHIVAMLGRDRREQTPLKRKLRVREPGMRVLCGDTADTTSNTPSASNAASVHTARGAHDVGSQGKHEEPPQNEHGSTSLPTQVRQIAVHQLPSTDDCNKRDGTLSTQRPTMNLIT